MKEFTAGISLNYTHDKKELVDILLHLNLISLWLVTTVITVNRILRMIPYISPQLIYLLEQEQKRAYSR